MIWVGKNYRSLREGKTDKIGRERLVIRIFTDQPFPYKELSLSLLNGAHLLKIFYRPGV